MGRVSSSRPAACCVSPRPASPAMTTSRPAFAPGRPSGGLRFDPAGDYGAQLHSVFYGPHGGKYERRLLLAGISNVLFLMLAAATLFFLMRREAGDVAALLSVFLFTVEPVVLGHS